MTELRAEAIVLAETVNFSRDLTRFYISKLKGLDMQKSFEFDGLRFNSPYWLIGHIAWAQNNLILHGTYGEKVRIEWLKKFKIGDSITDYKSMPDLKEVLAVFKEIHSKSIDHIKSLSSDDLNKENALSFGFSDDKSVRNIIMHQIRHESVHTGHLSWICKMHGIKTI